MLTPRFGVAFTRGGWRSLHIADAPHMKLELLLYSDCLLTSIIRFCYDFLFFTLFICTSLKPDLLFFRNESLSTAAISSVAPFCLRLNRKICSEFFVFSIFGFDFVMTGGGVESRGDEEDERFVEDSKGCGFGALFQPFGLPFFFLVRAEAEGAGGGELGGGEAFMHIAGR